MNEHSGNGPSGNGPSGNGPSGNGPSGNGPSGNGPSGNGPSGNGPSGNGPSGNGPSGNGPSGNGPSGNGPSGNGPSGNGHSVAECSVSERRHHESEAIARDGGGGGSALEGGSRPAQGVILGLGELLDQRALALPVPEAHDIGTAAAAVGIAPEVWARVAWSRLAEPGDLEAAQLVRDHGHVGALALLRHCSGGAALTKILARFRPRWQTLHVAGDLVNAAKVGARIIVPNDPQWPTGVNDLAAPPHVLWVRGSADLRAACERSVAIVGARAATMYGEKIASRIAHDVAARGVSVVSGAAYGIDAAAHRGALSADGSTIAVLACSVERAYPAGHRDLLETIAARGLVVSELPPGCAPLRHRFLERNRLIATMTRGTLVVEAGLRSGSRNTARTAGEHLRVVMAVPGPVTSPSSAGCHAMIRDEQAMLVTDADEVMELIGRMGEDAAPQRRGPDRPGDELEPDERRVFDALGARPRTVEELAVITCLSHAQVGALLGRLSLRRRAERVSGGWIRP